MFHSTVPGLAEQPARAPPHARRHAGEKSTPCIGLRAGASHLNTTSSELGKQLQKLSLLVRRQGHQRFPCNFKPDFMQLADKCRPRSS